MALTSRLPAIDVYSAFEIAQAAGVPVARVDALVAEGTIVPVAQGFSPVHAYFAPDQALWAVRSLRADGGRGAALLFERPDFDHASARLPIAVSSAFHVGLAASLILISTMGSPLAAENDQLRSEPVSTRLVFIATPGPGGGGGGGGRRQKAPAPRAERKGKSSLDSPVPVRKAPEPPELALNVEPPRPPDVDPEPLPPVVAPVASVAANTQDRPGVVDTPAPKEGDSRGPGVGGGAGTGAGTGLGSGNGSGIGDGSGGGTGGGPYRPGSGIKPPRLLREVKAGYTEEAAPQQRRRRGDTGDRGAPRWLGERCDAGERSSGRIERTCHRCRAAVAICAGHQAGTAGRRRRRSRR